jgi:hypothetical protein
MKFGRAPTTCIKSVKQRSSSGPPGLASSQLGDVAYIEHDAEAIADVSHALIALRQTLSPFPQSIPQLTIFETDSAQSNYGTKRLPAIYRSIEVSISLALTPPRMRLR